MVVGLGMDLVEIERLRSYRERWGPGGLARLFTPAELDYCMDRVDPAPSLAARFAAKEAFFKAVGLGWGPGGAWTEVEVLRAAKGPPHLRLTGAALRSMETAGAQRSLLTLTHARTTAGAVVVLEGP